MSVPFLFLVLVPTVGKHVSRTPFQECRNRVGFQVMRTEASGSRNPQGQPAEAPPGPWTPKHRRLLASIQSLKEFNGGLSPGETPPPMNSKLCSIKPEISNNWTNRRRPAALVSCCLGSKPGRLQGRAEQRGGLCCKPHPTDHLSSSAWCHQQHEAGTLAALMSSRASFQRSQSQCLRLQGRKHIQGWREVHSQARSLSWEFAGSEKHSPQTQCFQASTAIFLNSNSAAVCQPISNTPFQCSENHKHTQNT